MTLRKKCRAFACPRHIKDEQLFCSVHFPQLRPVPRILAKIEDNREPPGSGDPTATARILAGTTEAVAHFARLEGRASDYERAKNLARLEAGQGGEGGSSYGGGGGGGWQPVTSRYVDEV